MPAPLSDHVIEEIRRITGGGGTLDDAVRETGCAISTASKYQAKRAPSMSPEDIEAIVRKVVGNLVPPPSPEIVAAEARDVARGRILIDLSAWAARPERIAVLSDIHHPFHDPAALRVAFASLRDYRPDLIVILGDYFDCYSISRHPKEPGRASHLKDEFASAKPTNEEIEDVASGVPVIFLEGNHEKRLAALVADNPGLHGHDGLAFPKFAGLPERWLYLPNQGRIKAGSLTLLHGDLKGRGTNSVNAAAGMLKKLRTSCLFGHLHRFQSFFETSDDGTIRGGFANGHLCDVSQADYITSPDWQSGFSTIDYDWPAGVFSVSQHMIVNGSLRWGSTTYAP